MPEEMIAAEVIPELGAGLNLAGASSGLTAMGGGAGLTAAAAEGGLASMGGGMGLTGGATFGTLGGAGAGLAGAASSLLKSPAAQSAAGSVAGAVASSLLSPKPRGLGRPGVSAVPVMPLPDDLNVQRAKRRSIASQMARRGRASTILTSDGLSDKLGD